MHQMDASRGERPPLASPGPTSPSTAGTISYSSLPTPRLHPLKPASQKEVAFINYVDSKIRQINRRYAKKFSSDRNDADDEARGYDDFEGVVGDLEHVFEAVWVSSTRTLTHSLKSDFCKLLRCNCVFVPQMSSECEQVG